MVKRRFADMARASSDDDATRGSGGDLGRVFTAERLGNVRLAPVLEAAAARLAVGEVSEEVVVAEEGVRLLLRTG